jgi:RND superfamily putative drug exporter
MGWNRGADQAAVAESETRVSFGHAKVGAASDQRRTRRWGAPVAPWIPTLLFAITFGLSMDYEVFVISAIRDARSRNGDVRAAVASGLGSTAGVITAAPS